MAASLHLVPSNTAVVMRPKPVRKNFVEWEIPGHEGIGGIRVISKRARQDATKTIPQIPLKIALIPGYWQPPECMVEWMNYFAERGISAFTLEMDSPNENVRWKSTAEYVKRINTFVDWLGQGVVLVGHSKGGLEVRRYLLSRKYKGDSKVKGAVLIAEVPSQGGLGIVLKVLKQQAKSLFKSIFSRNLNHVVGTPELAKHWLFWNGITDEESKFLWERFVPSSFLAFLNMLLPDKLVWGIEDRYIRVPLMSIRGNLDRLIGDEHDGHVITSGCTRLLFDHLHHNMMQGPGAEHVASEILNFIDTRIK